MNDDDLAGRVRAAVHAEAGPADDALADRLLRGTVRARRSRRTGTFALAALVLAGAGLGGATLRAGGEGQTLAVQGAGDAPVRRQTPSRAGAVTTEQAARAGVDGTAECNAYAANGPVDYANVTPRLTLYAAYLTDAVGFNDWSREYDGFYTDDTMSLEGEPDLALCWYSGDVTKDESAGRVLIPPTHQLVAIQTGELTELQSRVKLDSRGDKPMPVLAPPVPAGTPADAPLRTFPQPDGVLVLDELPLPPPPPPPTDPAACIQTLCADPTQEVVVRAQPTIDGEPVDIFGYRTLTPGQTVTVQLVLDVEPGVTLTDVEFGLNGDKGLVGSGPDGNIIGEVFATAPTVTGSRTLEATWTVPQLAKAQQLVLYYGSDKFPGEEGASLGRTLGGVTVPGAASID